MQISKDLKFKQLVETHGCCCLSTTTFSTNLWYMLLHNLKHQLWTCVCHSIKNTNYVFSRLCVCTFQYMPEALYWVTFGPMLADGRYLKTKTTQEKKQDLTSCLVFKLLHCIFECVCHSLTIFFLALYLFFWCFIFFFQLFLEFLIYVMCFFTNKKKNKKRPSNFTRASKSNVISPWFAP